MYDINTGLPLKGSREVKVTNPSFCRVVGMNPGVTQDPPSRGTGDICRTSLPLAENFGEGVLIKKDWTMVYSSAPQPFDRCGPVNV
ncbi:hypothetical protein TNCV_1354591 [Trichonephila clavipes]|uniref:Uncharacterized protein n=1 Tax=Trichonephila clavipes TaxID=2585209 RepID=A0A8X6S5X5_TRICX|nr:hypothetical protein TNCV_1354591 [Trichonephila clavipes]